MWIYVPAVVALVLKLGLIYTRRDSLLQSPFSCTFLGLLIILTISNVLELIGFYYGVSLNITLVLLKSYYVALTLLFVLLLQMSVLIVNQTVSRWFYVVNFGLGAMIIGLLLFSDQLIVGATVLGHTVTRIPGDYFFLFQFYELGMLVGSICVCIYGFATAPHHYARIRCTYVVLSVVALTFPIFVAIVAMEFLAEIDAVIMFPIGTSLFLLTISHALNSKGIYNILVWIPGTTMFKLHVSVHKEFMLYPDGTEMSAKERKERNEKRVLIDALIRADGKQSMAARNLGISQSGMSNKRKYYNI